MTTFGGLARAGRASSPRRCSLPTCRSFPPRSPWSLARLRRSLGVRGAVLLAAPRLGHDRAWPAVRLGRLSLGAARLQPGDRAADRAAGESLRRLRPVGPARADVGGCGARDSDSSVLDSRDGKLAAGGRTDGHSPSRSPCWSLPAPCGAGGGSRTDRCARSGDAGSGGRRAGQRRAGRQVESGAARSDHRPLSVDDAAGASSRARGSSSGPSRRPRSTSRKISAASVVRRLAREAGVTLLVGSDQVERVRPDATPEALDNRFYNAAFLVKPDGTTARRLPQDAPGAVRRVRAAQAAAVLRRPARRGRLGLHAGRRDRCCCRSATGPSSTAICYEVVYGNLIRQFVLDGQRAADDDYQRRLVRTVVGARTSTGIRRRCARSRTAAISRAPPTPASAASSIPTAACPAEVEALRAGGPRRRRAVARGADDLHAHRRPGRLAVAACDCRAAGVARECCMLKLNAEVKFERWNFDIQHSAFSIQHCFYAPRRSASQVRGSGAPRRRPAELSLTPPAPLTN